MIRIRSDESLFIISRRTLANYPNSELYKIIYNDATNHYVVKEIKDDHTTLYIDVDPEIMKCIIKLMRGGSVHHSQNVDVHLLHTTLEKLGFFNLISASGKLEIDSLSLSDITNSTLFHGSELADTDIILIEDNNDIENIFKSYEKKNNLDLAELDSSITKSLNASIKLSENEPTDKIKLSEHINEIISSTNNVEHPDNLSIGTKRNINGVRKMRNKKISISDN